MKKIFLIIIIINCTNYVFAYWELTGPGYASVSAIYKDSTTLFAGAQGRLYSSTNFGDSWKLLNDYGEQRFEFVYDIITKDNKIYVGTYQGLFTSRDNGKNWKLDSIAGNLPVVFDKKKCE